ncbi:uncharacterized protein [Diadema antillarum]|uniref:uncharacterized protein n=1 Tax=Diadema antillarum TaxID=105358 RepID=UPI003A899662
MPNVRDQLPFVICSAGGAGSQVKHSSLDNSMPRWKDGKIVVAEGRDGHCVLIVEYKVGPPKSFKLFNNVKSKTYTQTNPSRLVIALRDGSMVHINHAPTVALSKLSEVIDNVSKQAKPGRQLYGQNCQNQMISPPSRSPQAKTVRMSPRNDTTTPKRVQRRDSGDSPRVGTKTSTPRRPNPFSPRLSRKRRAPDDDTTIESDGSDEENLGASMLFSDQVDKENQPTCEKQSVLQMRKKGGGSIFMECFEEKHRQRDEQKRKGPNPAMSVSVNFYNRSKQMAGYGASDIMSM